MKFQKIRKGVKLFSIAISLTFLSATAVNAESIKINGVTCDYSNITFEQNMTPTVTLTNCGVSQDDPIQPNSNLPSPIAPVGNITSGKPSTYSWNEVFGATYYLIRVSRSATDHVKYIHIGGSDNPNQIDSICNNGICEYDASNLLYQGQSDLLNGNYTWTVRVKESGELNTTFDQVQSKTFTVNVQQNLEVAAEASSHFEADWTNLYYNPNTGENNYTTKLQLRELIGTGPGEGYQQITSGGVGKEVYIINQSRNVTTIIPSCVNGQEYSFSGALCQIDEPFKRNEIYSLRGRSVTTSNYTGASITKDAGQLYSGNGESYKVVLSPYPGEMNPDRAGSFVGDCETTAFGYLYMSLKGSGVNPDNTVNECQVPPGTDFYVNVELLDENSRTICDSALCQVDIKLSGVQGSPGL